MRMISLRVDSSIVFTLHRHVGAERCHGSGVTGQPFKTWLKDAPVLWRDSSPALMGQPYFHAGELPQQPSELLEDPVAGLLEGQMAKKALLKPGTILTAPTFDPRATLR